MSSSVRNYTDSELIDRVALHAWGFDGWHKGAYDIWVRAQDQHPDVFEDKVYTFEVPEDDATPVFQKVCHGTSHAGTYGLLHFRDYNPLGCAVLGTDRIVYGSHNYGLHKGKYPAYVQVRPFPYYRDNDLDVYAEEIGPEHFDVIGANCHRAAAVGESTRIYNWSVACLVRNVATEFYQWMNFMAKRPLNVTILKEF